MPPRYGEDSIHVLRQSVYSGESFKPQARGDNVFSLVQTELKGEIVHDIKVTRQTGRPNCLDGHQAVGKASLARSLQDLKQSTTMINHLEGSKRAPNTVSARIAASLHCQPSKSIEKTHGRTKLRFSANTVLWEQNLELKPLWYENLDLLLGTENWVETLVAGQTLSAGRLVRQGKHINRFP